jgi:dTDP-glucose 4,6-dehydratase
VGEHPDSPVVAFDALTYAETETNLTDVREQVSFVHADIGDSTAVARVLDEHEVDVVVNFAIESYNSLAVLEPARFFRTNVLGTQSLLESCRRTGVRRFHRISTCEVYGDLALDAEQAFTEESPYRPRTPYNASKAGADHAVRSYGETFGLPVTITNCANNYGSHQFPEMVLPLFTTHALDGEALRLRIEGQPARVDPHPGPLQGNRRRAARRPPRGDLPRRHGHRSKRRAHRRPGARRARPSRVAKDDSA